MRECGQCGGKLPRDAFPSRGQCCHECVTSNKRVANRERNLRRDNAMMLSDGEPARRLRRWMARSKAGGEDFELAWKVGVKEALGEAEEAMMWKRAFTATKRHWRDAYQDRGVRRPEFEMLELVA
jgi:hypothetical protein